MPLTSPPFATGTLRALQALAVRSHEDLRRIGAVKTFLLLKAGGLTATRSILWQLSAACRGIRHGDTHALFTGTGTPLTSRGGLLPGDRSRTEGEGQENDRRVNSPRERRMCQMHCHRFTF